MWYFRSPLAYFHENTPKEEFGLDFLNNQDWEKRDSQKVINDNKAKLKLLPENDLNIYIDLNEDEVGHNTKPCFSVDVQSAQDIEDNLPSVSFPQEVGDSFEVEAILGDVEVSPLDEKRPAVVLNEAPVKFEWRQNDELDVDSISNVHTKSLLELGKKSDQTKKGTNEAFEWNNFLVRRACFRGISEYYKSKFSKINTSWQRKRVNKKKKTPMHELIKEFATNEFGTIVDNLSDDQWVEFRNTLYSIVFSHRYKKHDDFLEGVDFTLIRGVLYSYTTEMRVELMSNPFFSLAVQNFLEKGKDSFVKSKVADKPKLYAMEIEAEFDALKDEAQNYLGQYNLIESGK